MKIAKACSECRSGKRKCTREGTGTSCKECEKRDLICSLGHRQGHSNSGRYLLPSDSVATDTRAQITVERRMELINLYIEAIHDKPHTLFHPPTLVRQAEDGSLPAKILYSVLAMAARVSKDTAVRQLSAGFVEWALEKLKPEIDDICLETIQALVLLGNFYGAGGNNQAEALYFGTSPPQNASRGRAANYECVGIAFRMAQILHLPTCTSSDNEITKETKIRVFWSLYMADLWSSAGHDLPRQIRVSDSYLLPMDEVQFDQLQPDSYNQEASRPGLWGRMIQLVHVFRDIQDLHRKYVDCGMSDLDIEATTWRLSERLDDFVRSLPQSVQLREENIQEHAEKGLGPAFVALHLGYHHYSTLLYFHYLDLRLEQNVTVTSFASKCRHHAAAYSDLLRLSWTIPRCKTVYFIVAHMIVVSSATLLHTLLFGEQSELLQARQRLEFNFEALVELRQYWPAVDQLMEKLFIFQRACMWKANQNTHKADRWMVMFLLQHALPVPEKYPGQKEVYTARDEYADDALAILREAE